MLHLTEWLAKVGFENGNPFALKQADEEGDLLQEYFVEHPAYNAMLDIEHPRTSILHAPRGAGKSSTRRMFERYCVEQAAYLRLLVIDLMDWNALLEQAGTPIPQPRDYLDEILRQMVVSLATHADDSRIDWAPPPVMYSYLQWICGQYGDYLTPPQRESLRQWGLLPAEDSRILAAYDIRKFPVVRSLHLLVELLQSLGYRTCYVLVDRIDELAMTAANWEAGADLLAPLLGNLPLVEVPNFAFKFFIPSEIVTVLRQRRLLREDRIGCFALQWSEPRLKELLQTRLMVYSNDLITSLASLAEPDVRDIDHLLCMAANCSPRHLLRLGEGVLQRCAADSDDDTVLIQRAHVDAVLARIHYDGTMPSGETDLETPPVAPSTLFVDAAAEHAQPCAAGVPLLSVRKDGSVWRGDEELIGWRDLPSLQRRFLQYLYDHRGSLCHKRSIIDYIWHDKPQPVGDDSLRKLVKRVITFVEPDPDHPRYIHKVRGGHYRLDYTDDNV